MKRMLTSCFGLGLLPIAPGTWGSLPVVAVFMLLCYSGAGPMVTSIVMLIIMLTASAVCVAYAPQIIEATGKKDPREVVADEVAGQGVTFIGAWAVGGQEILAVCAVGFLAFRLLDIVKPFPCRSLEKLPMGWGVLADDLMAGVYAAIVLQICIRFFIG